MADCGHERYWLFVMHLIHSHQRILTLALNLILPILFCLLNAFPNPLPSECSDLTVPLTVSVYPFQVSYGHFSGVYLPSHSLEHWMTKKTQVLKMSTRKNIFGRNTTFNNRSSFLRGSDDSVLVVKSFGASWSALCVKHEKRECLPTDSFPISFLCH